MEDIRSTMGPWHHERINGQCTTYALNWQNKFYSVRITFVVEKMKQAGILRGAC